MNRFAMSFVGLLKLLTAEGVDVNAVRHEDDFKKVTDANSDFERNMYESVQKWIKSNKKMFNVKFKSTPNSEIAKWIMQDVPDLIYQTRGKGTRHPVPRGLREVMGQMTFNDLFTNLSRESRRQIDILSKELAKFIALQGSP